MYIHLGEVIDNCPNCGCQISKNWFDDGLSEMFTCGSQYFYDTKQLVISSTCSKLKNNKRIK